MCCAIEQDLAAFLKVLSMCVLKFKFSSVIRLKYLCIILVYCMLILQKPFFNIACIGIHLLLISCFSCCVQCAIISKQNNFIMPADV